MFDREKQVVISRFCKAIFHETEKISVLDLLNLNIPDSIKSFIEQEIKNKVEKEFDEFKKYSKFDLEAPAVKPLYEELKVLLGYNYQLNLEELSLLLKLALDLNLDYLLKPCDTLTEFVFHYEEFQNVSLIRERLKFVKEYEYFPLLITEYFNRTGITKISKSDFLNLLYKIEKEYTKDFTILDHYNLFSRFKSFLLELNLFINDYPEYEAFIIHLNDKNHLKIAKFLEDHKEHFKNLGISVQAYLKSLMQPALQGVKSQTIGETTKITDEKIVYPEKIEEELVEPNEKEAIETIEQKFEDKSTEEIKADTTEKLDEQSSKSAIEEQRKSELFEKLKPTQSIQREKKFDRNLDGLMPPRLKKKIIKKIFAGNELTFQEFMNSINKVENWDEASVLLTDLFDKKNIQPFSKWAIKFTEFLYENIK